MYLYVMSKLTLHVPEDLVIAAKKEAAVRDVSVSKMVSDYFRTLSTDADSPQDLVFPPITASLIGCARDGGDKESYLDFLEKKHS